MERSFADLCSDAFSETSAPSFLDGDLDFKTWNFDEKLEEDETGISYENLKTKEDEALHQEATVETAALSDMETKDMAENVDKEQSDEEDLSMDKTPEEEEEDYTSSDGDSEQQGSVSGEDEKDEEEGFQDVGVMSMDKTPEEEEEDYTSSDGDSEQEGSVSEEDEKDEEEGFQDVGVMSMDKTPEEEEKDYTSSDGDSEQEGSVSGEDEEDEEEDMGTGEKPGELLMVRCSDEFCDGNKEDRIFAEGQPLAPEGAENPQVRNEEQGDSESNEEMSYFERVPERGSEMMIKGDGIEEDEQAREEEKQEDSSDSECEGMKIEQEENVLAGCFEPEVENRCGDGPTKSSLEFPEIAVQNQQDLIAEVDSEEYVEKIRDFSGEEDQEAGESFADYPSDFSSCEYVEDGGKKTDSCLERDVTDVRWIERAEDADEEEDGYLYSKDLEVDLDKFRSLDVATGEKDRGKREIVKHVLDDAAVTRCDDGSETSESDSYSSSDDEFQVKRSDEELEDDMCLRDLENNKQLDKLDDGGSAAGWSPSDDYNRVDVNINWNLDVFTTDTLLSEDLLTTEDKAETLLSDETPAEGANSYSVVKREEPKTTRPSNQGSLDDSFFFNTEPEAAGISEMGQLGDDEYEEERNWEQENDRIKAFYEFYDDSNEENGGVGREIKVQFCTDPLSQVIHYETDSDRDSFSSSTDGEEDLSSAETSEELKEPDDTTQITPACDPPNTQLPEKVPDLCKTQNCTRKHKCLNMLKLTLKMGVVILMGMLMFWMATDQAGWFSHMPFF